jgi:hypothetical protein
MHFSPIKFLLFTAPLILILALGAQTSGTLSGTVNNAQGAAVPNAAVTVTPVAGGASQRVLTGTDGVFTITNLPPGTYRVDIEYSGYKRSSVQNIELVTGSPAQLRVELQQGDVRETVEVQASAVLIQQDNAEMSRSLDVRSLTQIPLYGRCRPNRSSTIRRATGPGIPTGSVTGRTAASRTASRTTSPWR